MTVHFDCGERRKLKKQYLVYVLFLKNYTIIYNIEAENVVDEPIIVVLKKGLQAGVFVLCTSSASLI